MFCISKGCPKVIQPVTTHEQPMQYDSLLIELIIKNINANSKYSINIDKSFEDKSWP